MKKYLKVWKRLLAVVLCFLLAISMVPASAIAADGNEAPSDTEQTNYAFSTALKNPIIEEDDTMDSKQRVTWDYIWFGSYPQSEVESTDSVLYNQLKEATEWDSNNEITLNDGTKYRRMKKGDATYSAKSGMLGIYYNWSDATTYHYFKYEPIKWRVLQVADGKALLLSDVALDDQKYNENKTVLTWEMSSIRSWLNGYDASKNEPQKDCTSKNFINFAFTQKERAAILTTNLENKNDLSYDRPGGNNTDDKVFLLAETDVYTDSATPYGFVSSKNKINDEARRCQSSTYAQAMGISGSPRQIYYNNCAWWLRTPGVRVDGAGGVYDLGYNINFGKGLAVANYGTRPALYLDLSALRYLSNDSTTETTNPWKLAMTDSEKTVALSTSGEVIRQENTISVPYTYSGSDVDQISVMITDKECSQADAKIVSYGALQGVTIEGTQGTGTGTFTLPEEYVDKTYGVDYYVYIMAEDVNENTENYVSAPVALPAPKTSTTTTLSQDSVSVTYGESYTLTAQTKADDVDVEGAEVAYYTDEACTKDRTTEQPTNAGTYYARGEYAGNNTYVASNSAVAKVEIKQADVSSDVTLDASGMDKTYDGEEANWVELKLTGYPLIDTVETEIEHYTADGTKKLENAPIDAGTYMVKVILTDSANNYKPVEKTGTYTIAKKEVKANVIAQDKVYDGNKNATVTATATQKEGVIKGEELSITGLTGAFEDANAGTGKKVVIDSSKATVTAAEGNDKTNVANYEISYPTEVKAMIQKANMSDEVEVDADNLNKTYDGRAVTKPSVTKPSGSSMTIEYYKVEAGKENTKLEGAPADAGTYKVKVTIAKANYDDVVVTKDFTIAKANGSAMPNSYTVKAVAETVKGKADGKITGVNNTMEYSTDGGKTYNAIPDGTTELTNLAAGSYFVRYKETANYKASDALKVTVKAGVPAVATKVTLNATSAKLTSIGKTKQLKAKATPSNAINKEIVWTSSNPDVATVDANGKVTAVGNGTATITAVVKNGTAKATCKVTVSTSAAKSKNQLTLSSKLKVLPSGNNVKASWGRVSGADGYYVYAQYCGSDFTTTPAATIKGNISTSITIKKINEKAIDTKKVYKLYVVAYKTVNGKNIEIGKSICTHVAGKNNKKYTNPNKVTTTKSSYTLKAGKTAQIKVSQKLVNAKKKALTDSHASMFRYASSDKKVATVDWTTGKITAVAKGTCKVYVYARNGYTKAVSVTVK